MHDRPQDDSRTDARLVAAMNDGDTRAFEILYRRHRDWVVALARRLTGDDHLALDVLQDTFSYLLAKSDWELRSSMKSFLYPVVRHVAIARQSRARRETPRGDVGLDTEAPVTPPPDHLRDLHDAVDDLPAPQREVLLLRFADDLPLADVATATGVPLGTVKSRMHHALRALRDDPRAKKYFSD